jgi:hypothetical protein
MPRSGRGRTREGVAGCSERARCEPPINRLSGRAIRSLGPKPLGATSRTPGDSALLEAALQAEDRALSAVPQKDGPHPPLREGTPCVTSTRHVFAPLSALICPPARHGQAAAATFSYRSPTRRARTELLFSFGLGPATRAAPKYERWVPVRMTRFMGPPPAEDGAVRPSHGYRARGVPTVS